MLYSDVTTALGDLLQYDIPNPTTATPSSNPDFNNILPRIFEYAEGRIYREMDCVDCNMTVQTVAFQANNRTVKIPSNIVVLQGINVLTNLQNKADNILTSGFLGATPGSALATVNDPNFPNSINVGDYVVLVNPTNWLNIGWIQGPQQVVSVNNGAAQFNLPFANPSIVTSTGSGVDYTGNGTTTVAVRADGVGTYSNGEIWTVGGNTVFTNFFTGVTATLPAGPYLISGSVPNQDFNITSPVPLPEDSEHDGNIFGIEVQYISGPAGGKRCRLEFISKDALDVIWPVDLGGPPGPPKYAAKLDAQTLTVAPTPDQNYIAEFLGVFRPATLSSTNTATYLTTIYPELFIAACMIFASGFQRDFSAVSSDPAKSVSWQGQYDVLMKSAMDEEARRKGWSSNWSPYSPAPLSNPRP